MPILEILFWILLALVVHAYGGYLIWIWPFRKQEAGLLEGPLPTCSLIIAAYNEEDVIKEKIENSLLINYPRELLEILVVTDGSVDQTQALARGYPQVRVFHMPERRGKLAAIQRVIPFCSGEILIFSDANCLLNAGAVKKLVRHYADPRTGAVNGEKKVQVSGKDAASTEGLYWKYESFLKKCDAGYYSVVGAAGELYSIRKSLYSPLPDDTILDDFTSSLLLCAQGYRVAYEPEAIALEAPSPGLKPEFERKVRIAAGGFQALARVSRPVFQRKNARLTYLYLSHRIFRWLICPPALILILLLNVLIVVLKGHPFYGYTLGLQAIFYALATAGALLSQFRTNWPPATVPFYFTYMNVAVICGFFRNYGKGQPINWEKIPRKKSIHFKGSR